MVIQTVLSSSRKIFLGFFLLAIFSSLGVQAAELKRKPVKSRQRVLVGVKLVPETEGNPEQNSVATSSSIVPSVVEEPASSVQRAEEVKPVVEDNSIQESTVPQKSEIALEDPQKTAQESPAEVHVAVYPEKKTEEIVASDKTEEVVSSGKTEEIATSDKPIIPAPSEFSGLVQRLAFSYKDKYFLLIASWEKSTHADVCSYRIYEDGSLVREIPAKARTCFSLLKRTHSVKKQYQVSAVTKDGVESEKTTLKVSYPFNLSKKAKKKKRS